MKKFLVLLAVTLLTLSMTACQSNSTETKLETETQTVKETETEKETESETETVAAETNAESETSVLAGTYDGTTYTNVPLNFTFTIPADWTYTEGEAYDSSNIFEFQAQRNDGYIVYILMQEDLTASGTEDLDEDAYLDVLISQMTATDAGYTLDADKETMEIAGTSYKYIRFDAESSGVSMKQTYAVHKIDSTMYIWILTSVSEVFEESESILATTIQPIQ